MVLNGTTVTASTSVILVDTSTGSAPYIVYFPLINTIGRFITVRDNTGYISTGNTIVLSTLSGAYFPDNNNTLSISQPYGFITLSVQENGYYSILNTFAFPTGSDTAYVYNINTNNIGIKDKSTQLFNSITTSTGILYLNNNAIGNVTDAQLSNAINTVTSNFIDTLNISHVVREYVAVGITSSVTIQTSSDLGANWYNAPSGTQGFISSGTDIAHDDFGYFVACGNNDNGTNTSNLGYIQWSFDGKTWYNSSSPLLSPTQKRTKVNYANGIWHSLGSGENGQSILWSKDRENWNSSFSITSGALSSNVTYTGIAYSPVENVWVACGENTTYATSLLWSSDGSNWNISSNLPNTPTDFYDVIYNGTTFIALLSNTQLNYNFLVSPTGSNNWTTVNVDLNDAPGYLGGNSNISIAVGQTFSKYSINNGYTWSDMSGFPSGTPTRPYYDGSVWWVGMNDPTNTSSNCYRSSTGSNNWIPASNIFQTGYPNAITSLNTSSNLNIQLISTVYSLEQSFYASSLQTTALSLNTFRLENSDSNVLNITSYNSTAVVYINTISTNMIETNTLALANLNINILNTNNLNASICQLSTIYVSTSFINTLQLSDVYVSTLYTTDVINSSTLVANTISSMDIFTSSLTTVNEDVQNINVSSITISDLLFVSSNANIQNLTVISSTTMNIAYVDTVSTNTAVLSTIQFIDNHNGNLNELYSSYNKLTFNGIAIATNQVNPLYFTYELIDNMSGAHPDLHQFSIVSSDGNINNIISIIVSVQDLSSTLLGGFYSKVGINTVLHIINPRSLTDHIFRIDAINESVDTTTFLFSVTLLSGRLEASELNQSYNLFIENIGIPPPVSPPSNTATVFAPVVSGAFNFNATNAYTNIPSNIGTYIPGGTSFGINLNNNNYSITNIPAIIGSIVYSTSAGFIVANVKCGSISATNGAYITIDSGVQTVTVSGLTINNFPHAANNINTGYSIYITLQFIN